MNPSRRPRWPLDLTLAVCGVTWAVAPLETPLANAQWAVWLTVTLLAGVTALVCCVLFVRNHLRPAGTKKVSRLIERLVYLMDVPAYLKVGSELEYLHNRQRLQGARAAAIKELVEIGPAAVPALTKLLRHVTPDVRAAAAEVLGRIGPTAAAAIRALRKRLTNKKEKEYARMVVAEALGRIGPAAAAAVPALIKLLKDGGGDVRTAASKALDRIDPQWRQSPAAQAVVSLFIKRLAHEKEYVREAAAEALGRIGPAAAAAIPALIEWLTYGEVNVCTTAAEALNRIDPVWRQSPSAQAMVPITLIVRLTYFDTARRAGEVIDALRRVAPDWPQNPSARAAVPPLIEKLTYKQGHDLVLVDVSCRAAHLLGVLGPYAAAAVPALIDCLEHWNLRVCPEIISQKKTGIIIQLDDT